MSKEQDNTETKPKGRPKKTTQKVDFSKVSKSSKRVMFKWSSGDKSGTKESMSEQVAEIMELKGLGTKAK